MPTGTRSSISTNKTMKPMMATASVLMTSLDRPDPIGAAVHQFGLEDQSPGTNRDQQHRRHITGPGHREKRPGRQPQVECEDVVVVCASDLIEQRVGLHAHHKQQHQRGEYIDHALLARSDIGPDQIDGDVRAAIRRGGNAPENQYAQQQAAEIVSVGNLDAEEITQQHRDEDVGGDQSDEKGRDQLDAVDETVHQVAWPRRGAGKPVRYFLFAHDFFGHDVSQTDSHRTRAASDAITITEAPLSVRSPPGTWRVGPWTPSSSRPD